MEYCPDSPTYTPSPPQSAPSTPTTQTAAAASDQPSFKSTDGPHQLKNHNLSHVSWFAHAVQDRRWNQTKPTSNEGKAAGAAYETAVFGSAIEY